MTNYRNGPPESEVPAPQGEPAPTTTATVDTAEHNGHEPHALRAAIESLGGTLASATVLSPQVDPFRVDTPAGHRDGAWLADTITRLGVTRQIHNRGLHYILLGQPKPDGSLYGHAHHEKTNRGAKPKVDPDWVWLVGVSNAARWLGYIAFDQIVDNKHAEPVLRLWKPPQPRPYVSVDFDVVVPDAYDLEGRASRCSRRRLRRRPRMIAHIFLFAAGVAVGTAAFVAIRRHAANRSDPHGHRT